MEQKKIHINLEFKDVDEEIIVKFVDTIKSDFTTVKENFGSYNLKEESKDVELKVLSNYLAFKTDSEKNFPFLIKIMKRAYFFELVEDKEIKILTRYELPSIIDSFNNIVNLSNPNIKHELIGFKYNDEQSNYFVTLMSRESLVEFNVLCRKKINSIDEIEAFINNYQNTVMAQIYPIVKDKLGE